MPWRVRLPTSTSVSIWVANWVTVAASLICLLKLDTTSNPQLPIHCIKMTLVNDHTRPLLMLCGLCLLELAFLPNSGHTHFTTSYSSIISQFMVTTLLPPYNLCTGEKANLSCLCTFGCRVYLLPLREQRPDKALLDARSGIFLGFAKTFKNFLY